jgi:hypothetical protein
MYAHTHIYLGQLSGDGLERVIQSPPMPTICLQIDSTQQGLLLYCRN